MRNQFAKIRRTVPASPTNIKGLVAGLALAVAVAVIGAEIAMRFWAGEPPYLRGEKELAVGRLEAASARFSQVLQQNPSDASARLGLASVYEREHRDVEAIQQYEMVIQKASELIKKSYAGLGRMAENVRRPEDVQRYADCAKRQHATCP